MISNAIKAIFYYLLLSVFLLGTVNSYAQINPKHPVFVLVHGAWHGGWCWQKVSSALRSSGDVIYTPTLSGMGEHKNTFNPEIDLNTHISDIVNLIVMEDLHDVVLVGHSYAGTVIAGVADRIPERLSKLVFLDAMIVRNGQSAFSVQPKETQDFIVKEAEKSNGLTVPAFPPEAFGLTNPEEINRVKERLTPQPYKTFTQLLILKHPFGNHLPLVYIACINPKMAVLQKFSDETQISKEWKHYKLNTGHDAMIISPEALTSLLETVGKK